MSTPATRPLDPAGLPGAGPYSYSRDWGWFALRGAVALALGLLAFVLPGLTITVMVVMWGCYVLLDGLFAFVIGLRTRRNGRLAWEIVALGLLGVVAGAVALLWPGATALTLVAIAGIWAIVGGVFQIVTALRLRREITGEWLYVLSGVVSVLFGISLVAFPLAGAVTLAWLLGGFALVYGALMLGAALRLRRAQPRAA